MSQPPHTPEPAPGPASSAQPAAPVSTYKSHGGLGRIVRAARYSLAGLRAAIANEAAFRQELALGVPLLLAVPWLAPSRSAGLLMAGSVLLVWVVELLNSAIEALADALSVETHPLLGRAKDLGSAAVMLSLIFAVLTWAVLLWP